MEKQYEEVTERVLHYLVSSDGEFRQYVRGLEETSDEYKRKVESVRKYEESVECLLTSEVKAIPHVKYTCDSYQGAAFLMDASNCCEDRVYVFYIRTEKDIETIFKWGKVLTKSEPSVGKRLSLCKYNTDGTPRLETSWYWTRYSDEKGNRYCNAFDPGYFVGKHVVVTENCDGDFMIIHGTVEDIEADRKTMQKKVLDELEALEKQCK